MHTLDAPFTLAGDIVSHPGNGTTEITLHLTAMRAFNVDPQRLVNLLNEQVNHQGRVELSAPLMPTPSASQS